MDEPFNISSQLVVVKRSAVVQSNEGVERERVEARVLIKKQDIVN